MSNNIESIEEIFNQHLEPIVPYSSLSSSSSPSSSSSSSFSPSVLSSARELAALKKGGGQKKKRARSKGQLQRIAGVAGEWYRK